MSTSNHVRDDLDPIELPLLSLIVSLAALLLNLENKITNRAAESAQTNREQAIASNKACLAELRSIVLIVGLYTIKIRDLVSFVTSPDDDSSLRHRFEFVSEAAQDEFDIRFGKICGLLGKANRLINQIKPTAILVDESKMAELVKEPCDRVRGDINAFLTDSAGEGIERFNRLIPLLSDCRMLVRSIGLALQMDLPISMEDADWAVVADFDQDLLRRMQEMADERMALTYLNEPVMELKPTEVKPLDKKKSAVREQPKPRKHFNI